MSEQETEEETSEHLSLGGNMSINTAVFQGWTRKQWSIAAGRWKEQGRYLPSPTIQGAISIQRWWNENYLSQPGEFQLEGVAPEIATKWSCQMMLNVLTQAEEMGILSRQKATDQAELVKKDP